MARQLSLATCFIGLALSTLAAGCPATVQPDAGDADASIPGIDADADAAVDAAAETAPDGATDRPTPLPGSTEALLDEACAGRPRAGAPAAFAYAMGEPIGALRNMAPGDFEAVHWVVTEPTRIERLRVDFRGAAGGRVRVRITEDYGRSQPDTDHDLIAPVAVDFTAQGWVDVPLPTAVDLHPARHAWLVVEHVNEPMGMGVAASRGGSFRSYFRSEAAIAENQATPGSDPTFEWFPIAGEMGVPYEFLAEASGQAICPRAGAAWFSDVTAPAGLTGDTYALSWTDVDGDGWDDVAGTQSEMTRGDHPTLHRNRGDGTFESYLATTGLDAAVGRLVTFADFDGDGDVDAYVGDYRDGVGPFVPTSSSRVWLQDPAHRFAVVDAALEPAGPSAASAAADCDGDGNLDLFVGQWLRQYPANPAPDYVFRGLGGGRFEDFTVAAGLSGRPDGRPTYGVGFVDYDNDGDQDAFVANYGGSVNDAWQNDGACRFTNVARAIGVHMDTYGRAGTSFGFEFGDYDNDGDMDAYETDIGHPRYDGAGTDHSRLLRNGGPPDYRFEEVTQTAGMLFTEGEISSAWGDYDNDGDLDLYVSITYPFQFSRLYRQEADHTFADVTYLAGVSTEFNGRGAWADYDRDGDLDFLTAPASRRVLFRNELRGGNHWLEVRLRDSGRNTGAIGARVTVRAGDGVARIREVNAGRSHFGTQSPLMQHFGLGASPGAARVTVRWPDGMTTEYVDVAIDRAYRIVRGAAPQAL